MPQPTVNRHEGAAIWWTGMLLTALCVTIYVVHPPFVQSWSNLCYDAFVRLTFRAPPTGTIAMLDVDEESLRLRGQWPWPRWMLADLATAMLDAGAAVVVFDMLFPEPDRTSPQALGETYQQRFGRRLPLDGIPAEWQDFDLFFAKTIRNRPVVLGCEMIPGNSAQGSTAYPVDDGFTNRIAVLAPAERMPEATFFTASDVKQSIPLLGVDTCRGFINALPDADGKIRSAPMLWSWGDRRLYPSLALEAYRLFQGAPGIAVRMDENGVKEICVGKSRIPTDAFGRMILNYRALGTSDLAQPASFPHLSAQRVLAGQFDPAQVRGRIVIVGTSAAGLKDVKSTPLTPLFSGMEIHATALDNLLALDMVQAPSHVEAWHALLILLLGTVLTLLSAHGNSRLSFGGCLLLLAALPASGLWLLSRQRLAFVPAWEILSVVILYPVLTSLRFWREERQRKWVRNLFQTMVSDRVLLYLEQNPDSFSLSGRKLEATVLFADLANFTTLSENMPPEQVSRLLNHFLSPMTDIVLEHDGYLDKYEGDLIMAVWGVPFATADHAAQACLAALEQQRKLAELAPAIRERFGCELKMRIGINTGELTAGNMGSERRFQYTVVGDVVNLASRLEQTGKHYHVPILLGEQTRLAAGNTIEARLLDRILVPGRSVPVQIYELIGEKGSVPSARLEFVRLYEAALHAYWERQWAKALDLAEQARRLDPSDHPLNLLAQQIAHLNAFSPPDAWDGVFRGHLS